MSSVSYTGDVGSLMYVTLCTWLDICFSVGVVNGY